MLVRDPLTNDRISNFKGKLGTLRVTRQVEARKMDDLEEYVHWKSVKFKNMMWQRKNLKKSMSALCKVITKNILNVDTKENEYNRIHWIGLRLATTIRLINKSKVQFKGFIQGTKGYRARKNNADISVYIDLIKRHYLLLMEH